MATHCEKKMPEGANFCPYCGTRVPCEATLEWALSHFYMALGHDFRERVERDGVLVGVRWLGAPEGIITRMVAMVPGARATERARAPGVGHQDDWLRVDIDVDQEHGAC